MLRGKRLARIGALTLLLGVSTLVALRYAAKYGWLAGHTHWVASKMNMDNPNRDWYL